MMTLAEAHRDRLRRARRHAADLLVIAGATRDAGLRDELRRDADRVVRRAMAIRLG